MNKDGGPAFPRNKITAEFGRVIQEGHPGMSLREYAIIQFMAALLQRDEFNMNTGDIGTFSIKAKVHFIAEEQADNMLRSLKKI